MKPQALSGLEQLLHPNQINVVDNEDRASSSATLLVSLFLILITFFVVLNNSAKPDATKSKSALQSVNAKFGKPTDDMQAFGGLVQPKIEDFTLQLKRVLGDNAIVQTTPNGDMTKVIFPKSLFFYVDEIQLREDKIILAQKTSDVLKTLERGKKLRLTIIAGLENYDFDYAKITALKNAIGITTAQIGLDDTGIDTKTNQFTLVITNE